jgi:hypothetical protein
MAAKEDGDDNRNICGTIKFTIRIIVGETVI